MAYFFKNSGYGVNWYVWMSPLANITESLCGILTTAWAGLKGRNTDFCSMGFIKRLTKLVFLQ